MTNHLVAITKVAGVRNVVDTEGVDSSDGSPTLQAYLALEATAGFVVSVLEPDFVLTISAADLNAAA